MRTPILLYQDTNIFKKKNDAYKTMYLLYNPNSISIQSTNTPWPIIEFVLQRLDESLDKRQSKYVQVRGLVATWAKQNYILLQEHGRQKFSSKMEISHKRETLHFTRVNVCFYLCVVSRMKSLEVFEIPELWER